MDRDKPVADPSPARLVSGTTDPELQNAWNEEPADPERLTRAIAKSRKLHSKYMKQLTKLRPRLNQHTCARFAAKHDSLFDSNLFEFTFGDRVVLITGILRLPSFSHRNRDICPEGEQSERQRLRWISLHFFNHRSHTVAICPVFFRKDQQRFAVRDTETYLLSVETIPCKVGHVRQQNTSRSSPMASDEDKWFAIWPLCKYLHLNDARNE